MKTGIFISVFLTFISPNAYASGIFVVDGTIKGFTEKTYSIKTKMLTYEIKKDALSEAQLATLKRLKTGQPVQLSVSTDAIAAVREDAALSKAKK